MPSSRNPFALNDSSLIDAKYQSSTANNSQTPSYQEASVPAITVSSPPDLNPTSSGPPRQSDLDSADLEEPPPYTPRASLASGETIVEVGPRRPFQTAPANPPQTRNGLFQAHNQVTHPRIPSSSSLPLHTSRSLSPSERIVQQFTDRLANAVNNISPPPSSHSNTSNYNWSGQPTGQPNSWTSYPGQNAQSNTAPRNAQLIPPPRHPSSSTSLHSPFPSTSSHSLPSMDNHSSDFARDFYAAGTGSGEDLVAQCFAPPSGPPPSEAQASTTRSAITNDGRPTSRPEAGHPLLKDGNLLVYPKGYECERCHNVGYKKANPQKPCKPCWKKYAKPFAGALVYSYPANTASSPASNFQKPLPRVPPPQSQPISAARSLPPQNARFGPGGCTTNHDRFHNNPPIHPIPPIPPPAGGSVTYMAGDPRIGGRLCWRCEGVGNVSVMFFDRETCPLCNGVGRLFQ